MMLLQGIFCNYYVTWDISMCNDGKMLKTWGGVKISHPISSLVSCQGLCKKKVWKNNLIEKIDASFLHLGWGEYLPYSCLKLEMLIIICLKEKKPSFKSFRKLLLQPWPSTTPVKILVEFLCLDRSFSWYHFSPVILGVSTFRRFLIVPSSSDFFLSFKT